MTQKGLAIARWFSLAWAEMVVVTLLWLPIYDTLSTTAESTVTRGTATLLAVNGGSILFVLLVPVAIAATALLPVRPALQRRLTGVAAALLSAFVLLSAFSVGLFFLPSAVALIIAAVSAPGAAGR